MTDKSEARQLVRERRSTLADGWVREASARACRRLDALQAMQEAHTVGCYLASRVEVQTNALVQAAWARGQQVGVPARVGPQGYGWVTYMPGQPLVAGPMGILQPEGGDCLVGPVDVCVVPGVAFDRYGGRVGYGRGIYDRLLAGAPCSDHTLRIGLAFGFQVLDRVMVEPHDIRMHWIVTDDNARPAETPLDD
ncbi:MAG: 5-formyltetrahydrofolate cyclo-ligase [Lentisphaerae bacterium RIFOXYB12_FULL_60_10]|nr:MAG: 5-formyltetrahydrofolate cyclo-ligase [Lentisphaerae bacterium RIFOXYB12_FULL_60_10]